MVSALIEKRLSRLEQADPGNECPRCTGTVVVIGAGDRQLTVTKNGTRLTAEASRRFHEEEQPRGQCPECGNFRQRMRIGWGPRT